jgi:hypothetical protein
MAKVFRQFYVEFPILSTAWRELRWSHYKILMRVKETEEHRKKRQSSRLFFGYFLLAEQKEVSRPRVRIPD